MVRGVAALPAAPGVSGLGAHGRVPALRSIMCLRASGDVPERLAAPMAVKDQRWQLTKNKQNSDHNHSCPTYLSLPKRSNAVPFFG